jgi:hypothetical protein
MLSDPAEQSGGSGTPVGKAVGDQVAGEPVGEEVGGVVVGDEVEGDPVGDVDGGGVTAAVHAWISPIMRYSPGSF